MTPHFLKFSIVGALGTLLNLTLMALQVDFFATTAVAASLIAVEISVIHNFLFNTFWTFSSRKPNVSFLKMFFYFNLIFLGSMVVNVTVAAFLIGLGTWYLVAQAVGIMCAFGINYFISTYLVFSPIRQTKKVIQPEVCTTPYSFF